jgi:hypothetical protein
MVGGPCHFWACGEAALCGGEPGWRKPIHPLARCAREEEKGDRFLDLLQGHTFQ